MYECLDLRLVRINFEKFNFLWHFWFWILLLSSADLYISIDVLFCIIWMNIIFKLWKCIDNYVNNLLLINLETPKYYSMDFYSIQKTN